MKAVRCLLLVLFVAVCVTGCGGSNDPVIPENPTKGPPSPPTRDGLPSSDPIPQN